MLKTRFHPGSWSLHLPTNIVKHQWWMNIYHCMKICLCHCPAFLFVHRKWNTHRFTHATCESCLQWRFFVTLGQPLGENLYLSLATPTEQWSIRHALSLRTFKSTNCTFSLCRISGVFWVVYFASLYCWISRQLPPSVTIATRLVLGTLSLRGQCGAGKIDYKNLNKSLSA